MEIEGAEWYVGERGAVTRAELKAFVESKGYITRAEAEQLINHALNRLMTSVIQPMGKQVETLSNPLPEGEVMRRALFGGPG